MNNTLGRGVAAGTPAAAPGLWRPGLRTVPPSGGGPGRAPRGGTYQYLLGLCRDLRRLLESY